MGNKRISELQIEVNPQISDLIPIASNGTSKRTTLGSVVNAEFPATFSDTTITGSLGISGNINGAPNLVTTSSFNSYTASHSPIAFTRSNNAVLIDSPTPIIVTDMSTSPNLGTYIVNFNSQFTVDDTSSQTAQAKTDLIALYNQLNAMTASGDETNRGVNSTTYGNETLGPGVYIQTAATNITGTLTLNGTSDDLFVFRTAGAFSTSTFAEVILSGGAVSNNVWFVAEGTATTGADSNISGSLLANQAASSTGARAKLQGRVFSVTGAPSIDTSILSAPTGTINSYLSLGSLDLFNIFCGTGAPSNAGASTVQLSVGTNTGAITGFQTATVGGSIVPAAGTLSIFRVGVYVDGVLIQDSLRSTSKPFEAEHFEFPIVLQTVTTITQGQTIDIRGYSEIGIQTIGPRMSLVLTPIMGGLPE